MRHFFSGFAALAVGSVILLTTALAMSGAAVGADAPVQHITERDFHIAAPKQLRAGVFRLLVYNRGPDAHELIVVREPGARLPLRRDRQTVDEEALERFQAGALEPGEPGETRELRVRLSRGRYVLFCNMSGHYLGGMRTVLVVR
jgi:uncharacterized cupredoxin-like copper-binding protein